MQSWLTDILIEKIRTQVMYVYLRGQAKIVNHDVKLSFDKYDKVCYTTHYSTECFPRFRYITIRLGGTKKHSFLKFKGCPI